MPNSITSVWKPKPSNEARPSNKARPSTRPIHFPLKQLRNQVVFFFRKQKQWIYQENRPISMQLRSAVRGSSPTGYQSVLHKEKEDIYLDKSGKFSRQPFSDLIANQPTCATYCRGHVKSLLRENIITEAEFTTLKNQIPDFDANLPYTIWKQIDVSALENIEGAVLFLPFDYYTLPQFLASKNNFEFSNLINQHIPFTHSHLKKKGVKYTNLFVDFLELRTDKKMQEFLTFGWYKLKERKGVVFKENYKGKITTNLLINFDKVAPINHMARKETLNQPVKFVFSQYNVIPYDPNDKRFAKTKEEQEVAIEPSWNSLDEKERKKWIEFAAEQTASPFFTLSENTWENLFPDEYKAIKDQQEGIAVQWDHISAQRFYLAHHFEKNIRILQESLYMSTVFMIEPDSGRMQGIYQVYTKAFGNKFKKKLEGE